MKIFLFIGAIVVALSRANPVIYRISEVPDPGEPAAAANNPEGRWIPRAAEPGSDNPRRTGPQEQFRAVGQPCPMHPGYGAQQPIGQPVPSSSGYAYQQPMTYPTSSVYPMVYYYQYPGAGVYPQQQPQLQQQLIPQQQQQQQLKPPSTEVYQKQGVLPTVYQAGSSTQKPSPPPGIVQPPVSLPVSGGAGTGAWQQYICSVFPYLSSCGSQPPQQQQQQQQIQQQPQPSALSFPGYTYGSYGGYGYGSYPGYQQMAQFPVYYIVQTETRPPPNIMLPPGTVGVIRITGPTPVSTRPEEEETGVGKPEGKQPDTVVVSSETSTTAGEVRTEAEKPPEEPKETSKEGTKDQ